MDGDRKRAQMSRPALGGSSSVSIGIKRVGEYGMYEGWLAVVVERCGDIPTINPPTGR